MPNEYELSYEQDRDYDEMKWLEFVDYIRNTIAPSSMAVFADRVNEKINETAEILKNCNACSMQKKEVRDAFNRLGEYTLKLALLVTEASVWLQVDLETKNNLFGR